MKTPEICEGNAVSLDYEQEFLRSTAWEISERKPAEAYVPLENHVALAMVNPCCGFAHWRVSHEWIEETKKMHADVWRESRMVLRLYDVSYITFNGLNANHIQDHTLPGICGQMFFNLPHAGTWQLGEVGFLLRNGEFLPAARSSTVSFPRASMSSYSTQEALLIENGKQAEVVGNLWEQENILKDRRSPKLRTPLRIAVLSLTLEPTGMPEFLVKLATGLSENGHDVHVMMPVQNVLNDSKATGAFQVHPLTISMEGTLAEITERFSHAVRQRMQQIPPFDIIHVHEWLAGKDLQEVGGVKVCSLTSIEATRRNGAEPNSASLEIEASERQVARAASMILVPGWLRDRAVGDLRIDGAHVHGFAMEGRLPNEWDCPLDLGQIKKNIHFGPLDRMLLFIGPLEHAAGPDLLLDALPVILHRTPNARLAFAGGGEMFGTLLERTRQLGVEHAVRFLGHVDRNGVARLLRASEALVLPSRYRLPFDDAVVDLARLAGRPVVTTHGGPAHLVRHEETGIVTYDNPGSMVWALDRILGDSANADRMGRNGCRNDCHTVRWDEVARRYLDLCGASFPQLSEVRS